jgi:hypothetical protein
MKITNPETIHASEQEFIDTINAELDWEAIEAMLFEKHNFTLEEDVDYKKGDLVVFNDQIAYKFDFHIKVPLSVVFGRDGNCLEISTSGSGDNAPEAEESLQDIQANGGNIENENISGMASTIAEMITDINQGDE